jgi:prepilin-type processing-associated H-X9-DG protein
MINRDNWSLKDWGLFVCPGKMNYKQRNTNTFRQVPYLNGAWGANSYYLMYSNAAQGYHPPQSIKDESAAIYNKGTGSGNKVVRLFAAGNPSAWPLFCDEMLFFLTDATMVDNHTGGRMNVLYIDGSVAMQTRDSGWRGDYAGQANSTTNPVWFAPKPRTAPFN